MVHRASYKMPLCTNQLESTHDHLNVQLPRNNSFLPGMQRIAEIINSIDEKAECGPPILSKVLINKLIMNFSFKPNGRRWNTTFKKACCIIANHSTAVYYVLCEFFLFPNYKTIRNEFKCKINDV